MALPRKFFTDDEDLLVEMRPHWVFFAGPLSAAPIAGLAVLAVRDPFVLLLGLPLFLLHALKLISRPGLRRPAESPTAGR